MRYYSQYRHVGQAKEIKYGIAVTAACKEKLPGCYFGQACHRIVSPALDRQFIVFHLI